MPNKRAHFWLGAVSGALSYGHRTTKRGEKPTLGGVIIHGLAGGVGGVAPDSLEPPTSPNHRGFLHSWSLLGLGAAQVKRLLDDPTILQQTKDLLAALAAGYGSHLLADSTTPKGLPLW